MDQGKSVTLATIHGKGKAQANQKEKSKKTPQADIKKVVKYYFCKKTRHMKNECAKFKK